MRLPFKRLRYGISEVFINAVRYALTSMPLWLIRLLMDVLFLFTYPIVALMPSIRKAVIKNLTIAFGGELSPGEIRRVARRTSHYIFRMPGDILYYGSPKNHGRLRRDVSISGIEHLEKALKKGKGVIGLGAHMTGFLLLTVRLANSGIPFVVPTKDPGNEMIRNRLRGWRDVSGVRYIDVDSPDKGKARITATLKKNELVYLIADERKKRDGLPVPFFGKEALTAVGPAVFSLKTGAPILPIFIAERGRRFVVDIFPPIGDGISENDGRAVYDLTLSANRAIEDYIRKYPD